MTREIKKTVLVIPENYEISARDSTFADEVRVDPSIESPKIERLVTEEIGTDLLARDLVSSTTTSTVKTAYQDYQTAKSNSNLQGQVDALETITDKLMEVVSGKKFEEL